MSIFHKNVKVSVKTHATGLFLYPLKTSENVWFRRVCFRGGIERDQWYEMG